MSKIYSQISLKTENRSNYTSQIYPRSQGNNYNLPYPSTSPSIYYSKINNEKDNQLNNVNIASRFSRQQKETNIDQNLPKKSPRTSYNLNQYKKITEKLVEKPKILQEKSFEPIQKNTNHSFFVSDFSKSRSNLSNIAQDKKDEQKPNYTLKYPLTTNITDKYHINNYKEHTNNIDRSNNMDNTIGYTSINSINNNIINNLSSNRSRYDNIISNNINYKERKTTTHVTNLRYDRDKKITAEPTSKREYTNKSYQGNKFPPKYYRNNPLIRNNIDISNQNNESKIAKNQIKPVAQKICNIVIKGGKQDENSNDNKRAKKIEYEEDNKNYLKEEENNNSMFIQRAQSIEQPRDKSKSQILSKKNKKILKIEKLKNKNFELKKPNTGIIIEMQKAQSFEQPREFDSKTKAKFEISKLKDCGVELIGKKNLPIDNKSNIEYNNKKRNINQYKGKKTNNEILSIPKPTTLELIKNNKITQNTDNNNIEKNKILDINNQRTNINTFLSTNIQNSKTQTKPSTIIMKKRSQYNLQPKNEILKKEEEPEIGKEKDKSNKIIIISHRSNKLLKSNNSNKNIHKSDEETKPDSNKNYIKIPNSSKKFTNTNNIINRIDYSENTNSRRNYNLLISPKNNERSKSSQKINIIKTEPTNNVSKNISTINTVVSSKINTDLSKNKNEKEEDKKNFNIKSRERINLYKPRKDYSTNIPPQNIKDDSKNKNEVLNINTTYINTSNRVNISNDKNENDNKRRYFITNKDKKDVKTEDYNKIKENIEEKEIKKDKEIPIISRRNNVIAINQTSIKNEPKKQEKSYISNIIRRSPIRDKEKRIENDKPKNTGITYISNINNNKSFDSGKNENKSEIAPSRYNTNFRNIQGETKNN